MKRRNKLAPTYPLASVLTAEQLEAVRPYLRATFTETLQATFDADEHFDGVDARFMLAKVAGVAFYKDIERALYARAVALGVEPVMAEGRR